MIRWIFATIMWLIYGGLFCLYVWWAESVLKLTMPESLVIGATGLFISSWVEQDMKEYAKDDNDK